MMSKASIKKETISIRNENEPARAGAGRGASQEFTTTDFKQTRADDKYETSGEGVPRQQQQVLLPYINESQQRLKEREELKAKWKTKHGFDNVMKRQNWNEHPKRPPQSIVDDLKIPYHVQVQEAKDKLKQLQFNPGENGKPDFYSKVKSQRPTFSDAEYFKTIFISGDDMIKELAEMKQKEIDDFNKKVVVASTTFKVNTVEKRQVAQLDRFRNIREDAVDKIGLRHSKKRVTQLVARQILAPRAVEDAPVSMHKEEKYLLKAVTSTFKRFDPAQSMSRKDMDTNIHMNYRQKSVVSKRSIEPVAAAEKVGPKWGAVTNEA